MCDENETSDGEYLVDSLEARDSLWDLQEIMLGRSARSILNNGKLKRTGIIEASFNIEKAKVTYEKAKAAKVGDKIMCAVCGKIFVKKTYNQAFCRSKGKANCKDRYWNTVSTTRRERALQFSERR